MPTPRRPLRCPPAIGLEPEAERLYDSTEPPRQTSQRWRQPGLAESAQRPIHAMNKWVHNLTMLAVLYHLLVGCCWHHAHGEPRAAARQTGCALDCPDSFHYGAPHAADEPLADGSHEHQGACENPRCTFVLPDPESVPDLASLIGRQTVGWADLATFDCNRPGPTILETPPPWSGPSLRLHLVIQALLI